MFTNSIGGRTGATSPRAPRMVATVASGTLALTMFTVAPVVANEVPADLLNVGFAGTFGTVQDHPHQYVLPETSEEKIDGKLERRSESVTIANNAAVFNGNNAGLLYTARDTALLTDAGTNVRNAAGNKPFRAEMIFTPEEGQRKEGTIFSAGGNLFVRYQNDKLRYGFSSFDPTASKKWNDHYAEVTMPSAGEKHVLRVSYDPTNNEKLKINLDGADLPAVTSTKQYATHDNARHLIGFGREVHPGVTQDRALKGTIHAIRVLPNDPAVNFKFQLEASAPADTEEPPSPSPSDPPATGDPGQPNGSSEQPPATVNEVFDITFDGSLSGNTYAQAEQETLSGTLHSKTGGEIVRDGKVTLSGRDTGLSYSLNGENPLSSSNDLVFNKPLRAEMVFTPDGNQPTHATIFSAGGNLYVRYQDGKIRYGFDSFTGGRWQSHFQLVDIPEAGKPHILRVEYLPTPTSTTMKVRIDDVAGRDIVAEGKFSQMSPQAKKLVGIGQEVNPGGDSPTRGYKGSIDAVRIVPENGEFKLTLPPSTPGSSGSQTDDSTNDPGTGTPQPGGESPSTSETKPNIVESLKVGFGGSLVETSQYTTIEGEIQQGRLLRADGGEKHSPSKVTLAGGRQGLRFTADNLVLGTTRITKSFLMEAVFVPRGGQSDLATLMSAGGGFSVRYSGGQLTYGWDHNAPRGQWTRPSGGIPAPTNGQEHVLSMHYRVLSDGSVILDGMLDGEKLPQVTGTHGANFAGDNTSLFGFGNDVHPAALSRGFKGDLLKIRVAGTDGSATTQDMFAFQPKPNTENLFRVSWEGNVTGSAYGATSTDVLKGSAQLNGSARVEGGALKTVGGTDSAVYTANEEARTKLAARSFVVETTFTPDGDQVSGATILDVGGKFFARYKDGKLEYGYQGTNGLVVREASFKPEESSHVLSFAYTENEAGATVIAWLDRVKLDGITNADKMDASSALDRVAFGNELSSSAAAKAVKGSFGESRFAVLFGEHRAQDFELQELDEICADMSHVKPGNYVAVSEDDCKANIIKKAALVRPTEEQAVWQEEGLTAFLHYGINTYTPNQNGTIGIEWGYGRVDAKRFNPTGNLDPDVWVRTLRDNGYRTAILVLKHHDGFMSWPTRYSDYSVKSSPWKNGKGDILREFTDAARKYGMKVGVYISPADSHSENIGVHGNQSKRSMRTIPTLVENDDRQGKIAQDKVYQYMATDYGAFFLNTLYEVLTEYGEIHEVWFDGATGNTTRPERYDYVAFYDLIHKLQPGANIAVGGRDIRWIGNEHGESRVNEWSPLPIMDAGDKGKIDAYQAGGSFKQNFGSDDQLVEAVRAGSGVNYLHWWPGEADMKLTAGWFAHHDRQGNNTDRPKSPSALLDHYEKTVGRNAVMLLNVPPTTTGEFAPSSVRAIEGFSAERRKAFTRDHALGRPVTIGTVVTSELTNGNVRDGISRKANDREPMEIDLGAVKNIMRIGISEDILDAGQVVKAFKVEAEIDGTWKTITESGVIGAQRIIKLPTAVSAQKFRITVTDTRADYTISNFQLWEQLTEDPGVAVDAYIDCSAPIAGTGTQASPFNSLEQLRKHELAPGSDLYFKAGTRCEDANITVWAYGTDTNKVEIKTWGEGAAPTIGGQSLAERFSKYEAQGWVLEGSTVPPTVEEPQPTPELTVGFVDGSVFEGTFKRGHKLSLTVNGLKPSQQVQLWIESTPQAIGDPVRANDAGVATLTWTVPENLEDGAHTIYVRSIDSATEFARLGVTVAGQVDPAPGDGGGGTGTQPPVGGGTGDTGGGAGTQPPVGGGTGDTGGGAGTQPPVGGGTGDTGAGTGKPDTVKPDTGKSQDKALNRPSTTKTPQPSGKALAVTGASAGLAILATFVLSASGTTMIRRRKG